MLFDSTLRKELARNFGATLVVILTIVLTMMLIRTLGQAAGGRVAPQDVVLLLGYIALGHLPTMLALSLFVAVVATLTRLYRESEMTIWFASGIGLARFLRPVLYVSWPVLLVVAALALFVWPWQNLKGFELKERFERRSDLSRVAPGQFMSSNDGRRVFFLERDPADARTGRNVFILNDTPEKQSVTSAHSGQVGFAGDDRVLTLARGQQNEENLKNGEKTVARFDSYTARIGEHVMSAVDDLPPRARTSWSLLQQPTPLNQGELTWRLGLPFAAANLTLLGIGLSATKPRRASNWNLLFALMAFASYYNLINLSQAWVAAGRIDMGAALLLVHGGAFLIGAALVVWRETGNRARTLARAARAAAPAGMRTVRRLFYADILKAVAFVAVAFLSLSFFIDLVDQLGDVGKNGYTLLAALLYALLLQPGHFYEVAPIAVLIGTIYTLAQMAHASEYTILRTGGLGPSRALGLLATLGLFFGILTFLVGDYLAPLGERSAHDVQAFATGSVRLEGTGAWLKDHAVTADGERSYSINVRLAGPGARLSGIRIFEFDADNRLVRQLAAKAALVQSDQVWRLEDVTVTRWPALAATDAAAVTARSPAPADGLPAGAGAAPAPLAAASSAPTIVERKLPVLAWPSTLSTGVVAAAISPVSSMSTFELGRYIAHLASNEQAAQNERITFWKRALYPFACLVMVALALPFAYLQARAGGVSLKVFGGIMLGISFVLLNNVAGHLGLLHDWTPWMVAATPSAIYLLLSLAAFSWLVHYR